MKTTVFRRTMKELHHTDKQPKVAVYEGVRSDESARRSGYERIGANVKLVSPNTIARSEGKAKRVIDNRKLI